MSVLIKGMEMPKNCHSCPMCLMRFCQAMDRELSERETRPNAKRPDDCPLVPVPPHGRLIDADAPIPLVDTHGKKIEVTVAHIIENNLGIVNAIIEAEDD